MARNGSGTMSIVNTFVAGNTITAAGHNTNNTDIAAEITNSLAIDGQSTMTGQIKAANGTNAAPSISFGSDLDSGFYRRAANAVGVALAGADYIEITTSSVSIAPALRVSGAVAGNSTFDLVGVATLGSTLIVSATAHLLGSGFIGGAATISGALTLSSSASCASTIKAGGFIVGSNPTATPGKAMTMQSLTATASSTYTTPAGVTWMRVKAVGGGGGGGGSGGSPGNGATTTFATIQAAGGSAGSNFSGATGGSGGAGGSGGSGSATFRILGAAGNTGQSVGASTVAGYGGPGGNSPFFAGGGGVASGGVANTGGGGGGAFGTSSSAGGGGGGGSGEYFELVIAGPAASYDYACGSGGAAGTNAGAGAVGRIIVEEYYS